MGILGIRLDTHWRFVRNVGTQCSPTGLRALVAGLVRLVFRYTDQVGEG